MNNNAKTKLTLGSSSKARKKLLEEAGFDFDIKVADIDEKQIRSDDFSKMVVDIAKAKLQAILKNNSFDSDTIIITSDFVVSHNGKLHEKPISKDEVLAWHKEYSNQTTICLCSIVVHHVGLNKTLSAVDTTSITWGEIPKHVIEQVVEHPNTYNVAGFTERSFFHYTKVLNGSIDTVLGLPIRILEKFLEELGYYA